MMRALMILGAVCALSACQQLFPGREPDAAAFFADNCAACHGPQGKGDGEMAAHLITSPPDLTQISARHGGAFPRDFVMSAIDGYARGAHFSAAMPEFGAGDLGDVVIVEGADGSGVPVPAMLLALTDYLEAIQVQ